jgi:hypothetical protein
MHLDGNRRNNTPGNLRYGSRRENLHQTYEYGGRQGPGKLTAEDVLNIRRAIKTGAADRELGDQYGVHSAAINHIRRGKTFRWLEEESHAPI